MRLEGASYEDMARAGGGILSTVHATRAASEAELLAAALPRVDAMIAEGVAVIEVKSGYGLDTETELRMLRVARRIARRARCACAPRGWPPMPCRPNTGPRRCLYRRGVHPGLRAAHDEGLVDAVDGFCESIAFDAGQVGRVFDAAAALGLPVKLHAEQLGHSGGAALAARHGALSADHLEYATADDARAMARRARWR